MTTRKIDGPRLTKCTVIIFEQWKVQSALGVGHGWAATPNRPLGGHWLSKEVALHLGASCPAIMIRSSGPGTRRDAHRQKWFWVLLPKQKGLVCRGETLHLIIPQETHSTKYLRQRKSHPGFPLRNVGNNGKENC